MSLPSYPLRVQVISHDPEKDGLMVMLPSGQVLGPIRRLYPHADALRVHKPPLPVRGSWGLAWFPGGDIRGGFWMGAFHPNLVDSIPNDASDPFSDYMSHFSGHWSYLNGVSGYHATQWADNSSFVIGSGALELPTLHRHVVTSGQAQQRVEYPQSERNPNPQPPFGMKHSQTVSGGVGGLVTTVTPSGDFSMVSSVSGRTWNLLYNGTTVNIDASGNVTINCTTAPNVKIIVPTTTVSGDLHVTGAVIAGYGTGDQIGVQTHTHAQDADSAGDTEQETHKPTAGT